MYDVSGVSAVIAIIGILEFEKWKQLFLLEVHDSNTNRVFSVMRGCLAFTIE